VPSRNVYGVSGQVVLDAASADAAAARQGDRVDLVVGGQPGTFTVTGIADTDRSVDTPALFFAPDDTSRLSPRQGAVDAIGVLPARDTSVDDLVARLGAALPPGLSVLTDDDRGVAEFAGIAASGLPLILLSSIFGGMVIVVMALVVSATISLSVRQRQRELALLRATGATPKQVHRMVVAETMAVSALAVIGGIALGGVLGPWIFTLSAQRGVVPATLEFQQGIIPFAAGAVLALIVPWVTAGFSARAAARTTPIQALAEAALPPVTIGPTRRMLGLVFAAGTVALAATTIFLGPDMAAAIGGPAELTGAIAVALYGPELIGRLVTEISGVVRRFGGQNGELALINTRARAAQFASVLTPITVATAIALGSVYAQTTQDDGAVQGHVDQLRADAVVTSDSGGIAPALLARVRDTPGVASASALVSSRGWIENPYDATGSDPLTILGVDASGLTTPVESGSLTELTGNTLAMPAGEASDLGIGVGDAVTMRLGDGARADVTVVALLDSPANYASLVVPAELLAPHTTAGLPTEILVSAEPEQDESELVGAIEQRVREWPGTNVGDEGVLAANFAEGLNIQAWISYLLAVLAIGYAAIASVNTLAVAVLSRRREFAMQRLAGATRRQVTRMLFIEGTIVGGTGLILGTVISLFTILPTAVAVGIFIPSGPLWVFLAVILAIFAIVWPVTLISARIAMKRKPIDAINTP